MVTSALVGRPGEDHIGHHIIDPYLFLFDEVREDLSEKS